MANERVNAILGVKDQFTPALDRIRAKFNVLGRTGKRNFNELIDVGNRFSNKVLDKIEGKVSRVFKSLASKVASPVTGLLAGGGLLVGLEAARRRLDEIAKTSDRINVTAEALSELSYVGERTGVTFNTLTLGFQRMTRRISEAAAGTGEAKKAIAELGLDAQELNRLKAEDQFEAIAEAMSKVENEADKLRLTTKIFDSEGARLLVTLKLGKEEIQALRKEARELGISLSREELRAVEEFSDAMTKFKTVVSAGFLRVVADASPLMKSLADSATEFVKSGMDTFVLGMTKGLALFAEIMVSVGEATIKTIESVDKLIQKYEEAKKASQIELLEEKKAEGTVSWNESAYYRYLGRRAGGALLSETGGQGETNPDLDRYESFRTMLDKVRGSLASVREEIEKLEGKNRKEHPLIGHARRGFMMLGEFATKLEKDQEEYLKAHQWFAYHQARIDLAQPFTKARIAAKDFINNGIKKTVKELERLLPGFRPKQEEEARPQPVILSEAELFAAKIDALDPAARQTFDRLNAYAVTSGFVIEDALGGSVDRIIDGTFRLSDALKNLGRDFVSAILKLNINSAVTSLFGGSGGQPGLIQRGILALVGSAKGNVFDQGRVVPFAKGGLPHGVTTAPIGFNLGIAGERGREAIFPLGRTSDGDLGVRAIGGAGGGDTFIVNLTSVLPGHVAQWLALPESKRAMRAAFAEARATRPGGF